MSDNDLIRRGDALAAIQLGDTVTKLQARIRAIPYVDADPVCTCCGGTGITYQTEGRCACQGPDLTDPLTVHANMLRGAIAKPSVEQIVHLYGREAFQPMIDAAMAKALEKACLAVSEHADWPEDAHGRTEQVGLFARVINAILAALEPQPVLTTNPVDDSQTPDPVVNAPAEDAKAKGETDGQTLERLGMDGAKWAAEFRTTALRLGYSDMDEGWLIGWFANAIMAGYDRKPAPDAHVNETPKTEHDAGNVLTPAPDAAAMTPEVRALVEATERAWAYFHGGERANPFPIERQLKAALAPFRAGGEG